jgi:hypothetical protein
MSRAICHFQWSALATATVGGAPVFFTKKDKELSWLRLGVFHGLSPSISQILIDSIFPAETEPSRQLERVTSG